MFFDQVKINVKAGKGGNGVISFRREKFVSHGGPSGGNGGRGGHITFTVNSQLNTLIRFKKKAHFKAGNGSHGGSKNKNGSMGNDLIIQVPAGTVIYHSETGEVMADLVEEGKKVIIARGGKGGRGNTAFKTSVRQTPRYAERGLPGQEFWITLELKIIADVGIIGIPNAGKSTLLASVTAAKPKIADYPFTTLQPNLGVVFIDHRDFVMADIPGLIEGAHTGTGLGHQFLRHIERTRLLIHLLDGTSENPITELEKINKELKLFNPILAEKPQIVVLNKKDLPMTHEHWLAVQEKAKSLGYPADFISAVAQMGVKNLMRRVMEILDTLPKEQLTLTPQIPTFTLDKKGDQSFTLEKIDEIYHVKGQKIKEIVLQTYWDNEDAVEYVHIQLERIGVLTALREEGVKDGHTVFLDDMELEWMW